MCKEMSSWKLVINALYYAREKDPLSLNPSSDMRDFWDYVMRASESIKRNDICVYDDRYSLENVLWNDNMFVHIDKDIVRLSDTVNSSDIDRVNEYYDPGIRLKFNEIFNEAYASVEG